MESFIVVILAAAWIQSVLKLTLIPRIWRAGILAAATIPAFLFKNGLMKFNLQMIDRFLSDANNLNDFCALIVIQELLALLAGLSLLKERELDEPVHRWKYLALLPSLLLPVAVMYLTAVGFNHLVRYEFNTILLWTAGGFIVFSALVCELWGMIRPALTGRISAALTGSWMLVLLPIFLPAAATGQLSRGGDGQETDWKRDLLILGSLVLLTAFSAITTQLYRIWKDHKQSCVTSPKS